MAGPLTRLMEVAREGAVDLLGVGDELDTLREAAADGKLLARRAEDLQTGDLLGGAGLATGEPTRVTHREMVRKAYLYYFGDPNVRRTVDLRTFYVFGAGIAPPSYQDDPDDKADDAEAKRGQEELDAIWKDGGNKRVLTSVLAQYQKSLELQCQGNTFFWLRDGEGDQDPLRIRDLPEREIVDIITHPGDSKEPLYYVREFVPQRWNAASGMYEPKAPRLLYYRDWATTPPKDGELFDEEPWTNPPDSKIAEGVVYHVKVNCHSDMRFGISELQSIQRFAKALGEYLTSRMATVQAIASLAMQLKVSGGPRSVAQATQQLQEVQRLAARMDDREGLPRQRAGAPATQVAVTNRAAELQPMVSDTNAGNAATDIDTMKGQMAAGSGIPLTHLGGSPGGQAGSIVQDVPLLRLVRFTQELWRDVTRDILGYGLARKGLDPERVSVTMPAVSDRDFNTLATTLAAILAQIATMLHDREQRRLARWAMSELLDAMGKENVADEVDRLIPEDPPPGAVPPAAAGDGSIATTRAGSADRALAAAQAAVANQRAAARGFGLRQADELADPAAETAVRRERAADRVARTQEAGPEAALREASAEALAALDAELERLAGSAT